MNKLILLPIFLVMVFMVQIPAVSAWDFSTHEEIVENNYHSLPEDIQQNLDLNTMKEGSLAPDFKFFDFEYHSYPNSYQKAVYWLNKGQQYYENGDYQDASYSYGVASHYISDSFSAPHAAGASGPNHVLYEMRASFLKPEMVPSNEDLNSALNNGRLNGQKNWNDWIETKNTLDIQNGLNQATGASYGAIDSSLSDSHLIIREKKDSKTHNGILMYLSSLVVYPSLFIGL